MVPPLPAVSRPSKITMTRKPSWITHSCSRTSSVCRRANSFSYSTFERVRGEASALTDRGDGSAPLNKAASPSGALAPAAGGFVAVFAIDYGTVATAGVHIVSGG